MLKISRVLHAGYLFSADSTQILFDPIFENPFSVNCYAFPPVRFDLEKIQSLKFDAVFISHYHDDHLSLESLSLLNRETPIYLYSIFEEFFEMLRELGFQQVIPISLNEKIQIGPFQLTAYEALDADVDSIFHIQAHGLNVLNVVDSWIGPQTLHQLLKIAPWDLILWPFQSMRELEVLTPSVYETKSSGIPSEHLEQIAQLKPRYLIPSSCQFQFEKWSWYNDIYFPIFYQRFTEAITEAHPQTKVFRLDPGQSIRLSDQDFHFDLSLSWVQQLDDSSLDYHFVESAKPIPFFDLIRFFPKMTDVQKRQVQEFIAEELTAQLNCSDFLESLGSSCFKWKLRIYLDDSTCEESLFLMNKTGVTFSQPQETADWQTEILGIKLWNALYEGESLSSLYLRISPMKDSDPLEDPLLYALYHGKIGSYQKAQLLRLKKKQSTF